MNGLKILAMDHIVLNVADVERSLAFYCGVLGFELTTRFGAQAAFISAGGYHLVNRGDGDAFLRHGAAAVLPADGASAEGFPLLAGGSVTADMPAGDLHALTFSGTTTLLLVQVR